MILSKVLLALLALTVVGCYSHHIALVKINKGVIESSQKSLDTSATAEELAKQALRDFSLKGKFICNDPKESDRERFNLLLVCGPWYHGVTLFEEQAGYTYQYARRYPGPDWDSEGFCETQASFFSYFKSHFGDENIKKELHSDACQ